MSIYNPGLSGLSELVEDLTPQLGGDLDALEHQITNVALLNFDTDNPDEVTNQGDMAWNADEETVDLKCNGSILQLGQEIHIHVRNNSGSDILNGTAVMATGTLGDSGRITVAPMVSDGSISGKYYIGITTEDIPNDTDGKVTSFGKVRGINTLTWNEGDVLWLDPATSGGLTSTEPTAPNLKIATAFVISKKSNGTLMVRANQGHTVSEMHDVNISSLTDGDVLHYNSSNLRWENYALTLDDMHNVNISSLTDGDVLYYNSSNLRWENYALTLDDIAAGVTNVHFTTSDNAKLDSFNSDLGYLTTSEIQQLRNIDTTTISSIQWSYLGSFNQSLTTASNVAFNTVTATSATFGTSSLGSVWPIYIDAYDDTASSNEYLYLRFSGGVFGWYITEESGLFKIRDINTDCLTISNSGQVTIASSLTVGGAGHFANNGISLSLYGTDHTYMGFYPLGSSSGRKGYMGYGYAGSRGFTLDVSEYTNSTLWLRSALQIYLATHTTVYGNITVASSAFVGSKVGIGTSLPSEGLDVNSDAIRIRTSATIPSETTTGNQGTIHWDSNFLYVCESPNSWRRSNLNGFSVSPLDFSGLVLWFDADDESTITYDSSNLISEWRDKSGNGYDAQQATGSYKPAYTASGPSTTLDGSNDYLYLSTSAITALQSTAYTTVFIVYRTSSTASANTIFGISDTTEGSREFNFRHPYSTQVNALARYNTTTWSGGLTAIYVNSPGAGSIGILKYRANGTNSLFESNANTYTNSTSVSFYHCAGANSCKIGANQDNGGRQWFYHGNIYEIIIYNTALSDSDFNKVENYLKKKWNVSY